VFSLSERSIHVKGRRQTPPGRGPQESVISQMIITIGGRNIENDPGEKFFEVPADMVRIPRSNEINNSGNCILP
jgi:hypothetical protein